MDKQRRNSTITIKINGTERKIKEEMSIADNRIHNDRIIDEQIESMELNGRSEMAAAQEASEESFDWILPELNDEIEEYTIARQPKGNKKINAPTLKKHLKRQNIGPWKSLITSLLLAILIGTSFGFLVLKLVISDAQIKEEPVTTIPEETKTEIIDPVSTTQQVQLPPLNTFIIQGGVFSSVDSAKIEEQKVKQIGIPTQIIEDSGKAILILGIADSIEKAKSIGAGLKEKEIEVFAKPYTISEKGFKDLTEGEAKLLKEAASVYQVLASLTSSGMIEKTVDETALLEQKRILATLDKKESKTGDINQLRLELEGAIAKLDSYKEQPKESLFIEAQQHLLTFIDIYLTM